MAAEMEIDAGRIPFISIEAVAPDNGMFNWRDHYQRMLAQIQEPAIEHKIGLERGEGERTGNGRYAPWPKGFTGYQLQQSIENALQHRRPAAVFIDEAQHLGRIASGRKLADQLDVIKSTASRSHTVHVLIGTYELLAFRNLSAQLSRRSVDLHFSRYRTESTEDIEIFQNAVFTFQKQLRSCDQLDLANIWDFLYERSLGCIGILKDWLMQALVVAARSDTPALSLAVLERTALSGSQCEKMLQDAREGEARLADNDDTRVRLRRLLNLPDRAVAPVTAATAAVLIVLSNLTFGSLPPAPAGWQAVDTEFGGIAHDESSPVTEFLAADRIQELARASKARVIIFPETVAPLWTEATRLFWQQTLAELRASGKMIVFGAGIPFSPGSSASNAPSYRNAVVIAGADAGVLFQRIGSQSPSMEPYASLYRTAFCCNQIRGHCRAREPAFPALVLRVRD